MITIRNAGADIIETDYWLTDHAAAGLCYLSGNAGVWRLLVPDMAESMLPEMRTGTSVTIEASMHDPRCWDIVFEDGTDAPFSLAIDKKQVDRKLENKPGRLTVWTRLGGRVLDLACEVRT